MSLYQSKLWFLPWLPNSKFLIPEVELNWFVWISSSPNCLSLVKLWTGFLYVYTYAYTYYTYLLTGWLTCWLPGCLTDWLTDGRTDWRTDGRTDGLTDWMNDWLAGWLANWLTDWPTDRLTDQRVFVTRQVSTWKNFNAQIPHGLSQGPLLLFDLHGWSYRRAHRQCKVFPDYTSFFSIAQYIWTYSSTDNVTDTNITYTNLRTIFKKI